MGAVLRGIVLIFLAASGVAAAVADSRVPLPTPPSARSRVSKTQGCVEPTEVMRKNHMRFLLHQRDETVHEGIRAKKFSLNAPGQFCQSCHAYASVHIDCFQCHATTPAAP